MTATQEVHGFWTRWRWPVVLASLLAGQAAAIIAVVVVSGRDPSFAVEPDYYEKALAWDEAARSRTASEALGWTATVETEAVPSGRLLRVTLVDRLGRGLEGATVGAEVFHHARSGDRRRVELVAAGGGIYEGDTAMDRPGLWEVRVSVQRGPEAFTTSTRIELEGAGL